MESYKLGEKGKTATKKPYCIMLDAIFTQMWRNPNLNLTKVDNEKEYVDLNYLNEFFPFKENQ